jgi:UDP-N-acetylglucosamine 2-epimerase (non-hydrolysing)
VQAAEEPRVSTAAPEPRAVERACLVLGTRPEVIKLAGVAARLGDAAVLVATGQHWDDRLFGDITRSLGLRHAHHSLGVSGLDRARQIGAIVTALAELWDDERPDVVVVQGDTNSAVAGAIAANSFDIPLVHVEAGLRSHDRAMPEEHNRVVADHLSDLCLAPTAIAAGHLAGEGIPPDRIVVTGNTVIDAVQRLLPAPSERTALLARYGLEPDGFVLATLHRPENVDDPERFRAILGALAGIDRTVVLSLHPRSRARADEHGLGPLLDHLRVVEPVDYPDFLGLLAEATYAVSDSGGVQEEVSVVKRPVLVVRRSTERPEVIGTFARLATEPDHIGPIIDEWLADPGAVHRQLEGLPSPYGDGDASDRCADAIRAWYGQRPGSA